MSDMRRAYVTMTYTQLYNFYLFCVPHVCIKKIDRTISPTNHYKICPNINI